MALVAGIVSIMPLLHAGGFLFGYQSLVGMSASSRRYRHLAGVFLAVSGGSGDRSSTLAHSSNSAVILVDSGNVLVAGRPSHGLVGGVVRRDSRGQRAGLAHFQIQGLGRDGNGSDSNRLGSNSNSRRRSSRISRVKIRILHLSLLKRNLEGRREIRNIIHTANESHDCRVSTAGIAIHVAICIERLIIYIPKHTIHAQLALQIICHCG